MERKLGCSTWGKDIDTRIQSINAVAEAGFDTVMLPIWLQDLDGTALMAEAVRKNGMTVDEFHAPFSDINHIWYDEDWCDETMEMLIKCIDVCADLGVDTMVLHESSGRIAPDMSNAGLARFRKIFEHAAEKDVRPALENLRRSNYIARLFHENQDLPVYYCWDSGHEICYTPGMDHVALFPEKLVCTHIHDNSGVYMMDDHWLPFDGAMDWERKARFIKNSGYTGALTMELARPLAKYDHLSDVEFTKEALKRIRRFAEMCE